HAFDLNVAIIESVDQMRRGSRRFPARDRSVLQNDYGLPLVGEQIGSSQAGNPCANHAHIRSDVLIERGPRRHFCRCHPNGSSSARTPLHTFPPIFIIHFWEDQMCKSLRIVSVPSRRSSSRFWKLRERIYAPRQQT